MGTSVTIVDKDGGLAVELRSPKGDLPVYISPSGDRQYWSEVINITTGVNVIHAPASGKKFYVESIVMSCGASGEVQFYSGTTPISGPMNFQAYGGMAVDHADGNLRGRNVGESFNLTVTNPTTVDVGGYANGYDE